MFRWQRGEARLDVHASGAKLEIAGEVTAVSGEEFTAGALDDTVLGVFYPSTLVEARAAATHHDELAQQVTLESPRGRPHFDRILGGGRGGTWVVWFWGREVQIRVPDVKRDVRLTFDEILQTGVPADVVEKLPKSAAETVLRAVSELAPLPCMCGTGCDTTSQHGELSTIAGPLQDPRAPVDATTEVGLCRVCGRAWTLEASGDARYSYSFRVNRYGGTHV